MKKKNFFQEPEMAITALPGQLCMAKLSFFGIFGILFVITTVQATVVAYYVFQRLTGNCKKNF